MILAVAVLLTSAVQEDLSDSLVWSACLTVCGLGLLAVTANNPLTLVLVWGAMDITELVIRLRFASDRRLSERAVIAFSIRACGIMLVLMADVLAAAAGKTTDFASAPPEAGLLLLAAAGLRLGILPMPLPYAAGAAMRRDLDTTLSLVAAAASLALVAHIPNAAASTPVAFVFLVVVVIAGLYASWMWMRAPDELAGRPYWIMGLSSLSLASALLGNSIGATAWGVALVLSGGALFLASVQQTWLNRSLLLCALALSSLPFTLTATGSQYSGGSTLLVLPLLLIAQAFIVAGFVRHALRPSTRPSLESQPAWAKSVYPIGIGTLLFFQILLGVWGWDGALQIGLIWSGVATLLTAGILLWAARRLPILTPVRAKWIQSASTSQLEGLYRTFQTAAHISERATQTISNLLDGESGIIWTLLFMIFFVLLLVERKP